MLAARSSVLRRVALLALPALVLGGASLALREAALRGAWREALPFAPAAGLGAAALLGVAFNRSRCVFAALGLGLMLWMTGWAVADAVTPHGRLLREATAAWLVLCFAALAYRTERGLFGLPGVLRALALLVPLSFAAWLGRPGTAQAGATLLRRFEAVRPLGLEPGIAVALAAVALLVARVLLRGSPLDAALAGAAAAVVLVSRAEPQAAAAYATAGGFALVLGLVHESHRLAFRDELTELPGRRALNEALAALDGRYVVAMLDVDHFKKFNDAHGHEVGDQVLRLVAAQLRRVGGGGRPYRYGGEEFTLLFAGRRLEDVLPDLEAVRTSVEAARLTLRGRQRPRRKPSRPPRQRGTRQVSVTISIGVAASRGEGQAPAQVLKAADKALYRAKRAGRNQVAR